jgi:hypothetical protein
MQADFINRDEWRSPEVPYNPAKDGFVFSNAEIRPRDREDQALRAAYQDTIFTSFFP